MTSPANPSVPTDFIREAVRQDLADGTYSRVQTRFPPEPNGYLHIGHAKAIFTDFSIAEEFGGVCNLRFDDTNPDTEETEYVDSIVADVEWLGREVLLAAAVVSDDETQPARALAGLLADGLITRGELAGGEVGYRLGGDTLEA